MNEQLMQQEEQWTEVISNRSSLLHLRLGELWRYRDLVMLFVKRDFIAVYKQTILGPLWHFIQPLLTTATYTIIFSHIANISTDGLPPVLFYMSGIVCWNYFAGCLTKISTTFVSNAGIFGKVYFPRMVAPISTVLSSGMGFLIQMILFLVIYSYYLTTHHLHGPTPAVLLLPLVVTLMALLGLGLGIIVSSLTTKYRDLSFLVAFGVQLFMYATPVIYPASSLPQQWKWLMIVNPVAPLIETTRYALFGTGTFNPDHLLVSTASTLIILVSGIILFNKVERNFMDHV